MTKRYLVAIGITMAILGQIGLISVVPGSSPPPLAVLTLVIGGFLFALGMRGVITFTAKQDTISKVASPKTVFGNKFTLTLAVFGFAALLLLFYRLGQGSTSGWDVAWWVVGIAALSVPFVSRLRISRTAVSGRPCWDIAFIVFLMLLFVALNTHDLTDWYYSAIGDEYSFYWAANNIISDGLSRPFHQDGVYGSHPVLNSAYQALVMTVFGRDNFGWKMSSVLSIIIAIPGVYLIAYVLTNRRVAIISATLFSLSHYLFAYAHTGYNTTHPIMLTVWSLALFVLGLQRKSPQLLFAAGLVCGLGFYTHYAARSIILIAALFVLTDSVWRRRLKELWSVGLGFIIVAFPIFIVSRESVVSQMYSEILGGYSEVVTGGVTERIITNVSKNLLAFNYNPDKVHYVSGSLLDPVTAVLAVLGIGLALTNLRNPSFRLLIIWVLVGITVTGIVSPYPEVAISRLNYLVPPLTILAGLAAISIWDFIVLSGYSRRRTWTGIAVAAMLFLLVFALNVKQFWFDTPKVFPLTQEAITVGAMRSDDCGGYPENIVLIDRQTKPLLRPALSSYFSEKHLPQLIDHHELESSIEFETGSIRCVVFANPDDEVAMQAIQKLLGSQSGSRLKKFWDPAGKGSVLIIVIGS